MSIVMETKEHVEKAIKMLKERQEFYKRFERKVDVALAALPNHQGDTSRLSICNNEMLSTTGKMQFRRW